MKENRKKLRKGKKTDISIEMTMMIKGAKKDCYINTMVNEAQIYESSSGVENGRLEARQEAVMWED